MATLILVHGAWHGGWCWERITPLLQAKGHTVIAPDLPGMGADTTPLTDITLEKWARFITDLAAQQPTPVVLVGHSRAGVVISQAAERRPDLFAGLVYLAAFLVLDGQSMRSTMARVARDPSLPPDLIVSEDGVSVSLAPGAIARTFYNATDAEGVVRALAQSGPEPTASIITPVQLTPERYGSVPRAYIECQHDRAVPLELQQLMQRDLPCAFVESVESDHSPFFSAPVQLANKLSSVVDNMLQTA